MRLFIYFNGIATEHGASPGTRGGKAEFSRALCSQAATRRPPARLSTFPGRGHGADRCSGGVRGVPLRDGVGRRGEARWTAQLRRPHSLRSGREALGASEGSACRDAAAGCDFTAFLAVRSTCERSALSTARRGRQGSAAPSPSPEHRRLQQPRSAFCRDRAFSAIDPNDRSQPTRAKRVARVSWAVAQRPEAQLPRHAPNGGQEPGARAAGMAAGAGCGAASGT